jgi:hypothetical protein
MAITSTIIKEIGNNRIEGSFITDGVALPNTTGTIAAPAAPTANVTVTVASIAPITVGDLVDIVGIGPAGISIVAGINSIPNSTDMNIQGTRVSTAIVAQLITVLPVLFVKHNVKRITMTNLTSGNSFEWNDSMPYGSALKILAAGAQTFSAAQGFYVRGAAVYLHPTMYELNSTYTFSMDY